jgi:hypothetical protein
VRFTETGDSVASGDLELKRGIGGDERFAAKATAAATSQISKVQREPTMFGCCGRFDGESPFPMIPADSELKGESTCLPVNRRSPKGVPIYGKSVICRYAVVNVRCGAKLDAGGKAGRRRKAGCCGAA